MIQQIARQDGNSGEAADANGVNIVDDPIEDYKEALGLLKKQYYGPAIDAPRTRKLTYEAIRGMLFSLRDMFSSFLDPNEWERFHADTSGNFEGIGAYLLPDGLFVKVARPIEGGPAEKAGIKANDVIVKVDGKSTKGRDIDEVVRSIKGPRGTKVHLSIKRGEQSLSFHLTRARVIPPTVEHWMEDKEARIGHIAFKDTFSERSIEQLEVAFRDLERQGMKALVFDLRSNPGGLLDVAIQVASTLIPPNQNRELNNVVVHIREGNGKEQTRNLQGEYFRRQIPMVVLVNEGSASASEIVAGAVQDYGVGTIMGERTFGKGKVQTLFPLDDGSALRLTTALYFPPKRKDINFSRDENGRKIEGTGGIAPDIEVKQSDAWKKTEDFKDKVNDLQLKKALEFLRARLNGMTVAQATEQIQKAP